MSVHVVELANDSDTLEVRWRDPVDRTNRSKRFDDDSEADRFDAAMKAWAAKVRADAAWDAIPPDVRAWAKSVSEQ